MQTGWGFYRWVPPLGPEYIHPEDRPIVEARWPVGHLCQVAGRDGEYLLIRYGGGEFRGKPELFEPTAAPRYGYGDVVQTLPPRTPRVGIVRVVIWHSKRGCPYFLLNGNSERRSSRYWAEELEGVSPRRGVRQ